ncbi:MAG TPA: MXAN_5808 family serine peptidase, partial [Fredinandcohnia sp.]|nr:MXAN_5808 family serine peptidase [Fredinandcohnia sp.]
QGNTARALHAAIADLRKKARGELTGLVLDLRSNPGGLLDQAIQVSDTFLRDGPIVATVGKDNRPKEVKKATDQKDALLEKDLPLAVLVNGSSASASEIVAGALKNLDRAVVIGRPTFGKGSVQVLYDLPDESALKLTIAQYLTAGEVSIQETGITPDVELVASRVDAEAVQAFAPVRTMREVDLERHLANPADLIPMGQSSEATARKEDPGEQALFRLRYLRDERPKDELVDEEAMDEADPGEEFFEDFQIRFAKGLLQAAPFPQRARILEQMKAYVDRIAKEEEHRFEQAIRDLGVDWQLGARPAKKPELEVSFSPAPDETVAPSKEVPLTVTVTNRGSVPAYRVRAWTESDSNRLLDRREFLFGHIPPGASRSWTTKVEIPPSVSGRRDPVTLRLEDGFDNAYDPVMTEVSLAGSPRPRFAFSWQVSSQDGLGLPIPGRKLELRVDVQNLGEGPSSETTFASIKNKGSEKIFIEKGRWKVGAIAPGEVAQAKFELELKEGYTEETMPLRLVIFDEDLEELTVEELEIPVLRTPPAFTPFAKRVRARDALSVRSAPHEAAPVLGSLEAGSVVESAGRLDRHVKIQWGEGRFGFVPADGVEPTQDKPTAEVELRPGRIPPRIVLHVDAKGGIVSLGERYGLQGTVSGPGLRDVYVFVNDQKVFFERAGGRDTLDFTAEFPLKEGVNHVVVVARDENELTSRRMISVLRRNAEMARRLPAPPAP